MKAAVWHGYKDVRIEEKPIPEPKAGQVRIKVDYAGICGTDRGRCRRFSGESERGHGKYGYNGLHLDIHKSLHFSLYTIIIVIIKRKKLLRNAKKRP